VVSLLESLAEELPTVKVMNKIFLLLGAVVCAFAQPVDPAKTLYDHATRSEEEGRLDSARLTFLVLASTYTDSPLVSRAKTEIGALCLFEEARQLQLAGKTRAAWINFRAIARVYPESPLAKKAELASPGAYPR
jgi:outer membrane protein assembly factor BamD (BamD/ComL family)